MSSTAYPALGFDPAPGDVAQVERLVSQLRTTGSELTSIRNEIRAIGRMDGAWVGKSATAFVDQLGELPGYLDRATSSTDTALRALGGWQRDLEEFERMGRVYEQRAEEARQRVAAARASLTTLPETTPDMSDQQVQELQERTQAAQQSVNAADAELSEIVSSAQRMLDEHQARASEVAALVRTAADEAPPDPSWWEEIGNFFEDVGEFFVNIADAVVTWVKTHGELLKLIGDLLADIALVVGLVAIALGGPLTWVIAAGLLSLGAFAFHGVADSVGAEVSTKTLVYDALGVFAAGLGVGGKLIAASGMRMAAAGSRTMRSVSVLRHPFVKLAGARTLVKGRVVAFGGRVMARSGDELTKLGTVGSVRSELVSRGPSWKAIPVIGSGANLIEYFTDDSEATATGRGSVSTAGTAFADRLAALRAPLQATPAG